MRSSRGSRSRRATRRMTSRGSSKGGSGTVKDSRSSKDSRTSRTVGSSRSSKDSKDSSSRRFTVKTPYKSVTVAASKAVTAVGKFFRGLAKTVIPHQTKIREISDTDFERLKSAFIDIQMRRLNKDGVCVVIQSASIKTAEDLIDMYLNAKQYQDRCYNTHKIERFEKMLEEWVL